MTDRRLDSAEALALHLSALTGLDPRLADIAARAGSFEIRRSPGGFEGLARIVTGQQVSTASADAIWSRFALLPGALDPTGYLALTEEQVRGAGQSGGKYRTLRGIAEAIAAGDFDFAPLAELPAEEAIVTLTRLKGIGPWTAEIYLMFSAAHPDIFPAGDVALQRAAQWAFGLDDKPPVKDLIAMAERWSPHRSTAALLLWRYYRAVRNKGRNFRLMAKLSGPMLAPRSGGPARQVIVLLHGYGADGSDLIGLGHHWGTIFPDALFVAPNAPEPCAGNPFGFQWFPLAVDRIAGRIEGARQAAPVIIEFLEDLWAQGIAPRDTYLVGFSQGAMMALHVGTALPRTLGGIVSFSGAFVPADGFPADDKPPVALIHGDLDQVVDSQLSRQAADDLLAAGFDVTLHISSGVAHGIAPDGLDFATAFLLAQSN